MPVKPKAFVLDTSALLTLIEDEAGAARVERILLRDHALIPFMSLLEVRYITLQERGQDAADFRHAALISCGATILREMDEPTLLTAARIKASRRVSLADAIVAAFAVQNGATLVHKDPEFEALAGEISLEALPYKHTSN